MLTRDEVHRALNDIGLERISQELSSLCEPCVLVRTHAYPYEDFPVGRSRIGGLPDLPATVQWPTQLDKPLSFLAQLNLSDLNRFPCCQVLPAAGFLWFFYDVTQGAWGFDPKDRGSWRVLFSEATTSELQRCDGAPLSDTGRFRACNLTFHDFLSLPGPEHLSLAPLKLTLEEIELMQEIDQELHEMIDSSPQEPFEPHHQILGHPKEIQGEMQLQCQLVSNGLYCGNASGYESPARQRLEPGARDWRLLLQLDTDDDMQSGKPGMMWGDCGRLYFWMRCQDLARRAFEEAWMVLQCT